MLKMYPVFFTNQSVQFPDEVWALTDKGRESDILQDVIYSMRGDKLWSKTVYKQKIADEICNILGDSNYRWSTREIWFRIIEKCIEHPEGLTPDGNTILPSFSQFTNVLYNMPNLSSWHNVYNVQCWTVQDAP